jgi:hypothetical protein
MNINKQIELYMTDLDSLIYGYENARSTLTLESFDILIRDLSIKIARLQRIEYKQRMGLLASPPIASHVNPQSISLKHTL